MDWWGRRGSSAFGYESKEHLTTEVFRKRISLDEGQGG
jgi:hypothetical protein